MRSTQEAISNKSGTAPTPLLESAFRVIERTRVRPEQLRNRLIKIFCIMGLGVLGCVISLLIIAFAPPQSGPAQKLLAFAVFCSLSIIIASVIGLSIVNLDMYAYRRLRWLIDVEESIRETEEALERGEAESVGV